MSNRLFDAVIMDLDGVITHTAALHIRAWKDLFDNYLKKRSERNNEPFKPFTREDYLSFVDGKPRYDGISSFLNARGIHIPYERSTEIPHEETLLELADRKNEIFNDLVKAEGVTVFKTSVDLIKSLRDHGLKMGVASSSKNCRNILQTVGLLDLFDVRIDGEVSTELGLAGKPAPDIFTTACDRIGVDYHRAVIVEDAVSGVQAGRNGRFGMVLGVARDIDKAVLIENGADIVVADLGEIGIEDIDRWFEIGLVTDQWSIIYNDYNKSLEKTREALLTVGNGYLGTRGAMEESAAGPVNYPGTYMAGVYNRLISVVGGRDVENEDLVNCPNWLPVNFKIADDPWIDVNNMEIESIHRQLDLKTGTLHREMVIVDAKGRKTKIVSERLASMANPHLCALLYKLTPLNYSDGLTVSTSINGAIINDGVERYRELNQKHIEPVDQKAEDTFLLVEVKTTTSNTCIAMAAKIRTGGVPIKTILPETSAGRADIHFFLAGGENQTFCLEKMVAVYTSKDPGVDSAAASARAAAENIMSYEDVKHASIAKWDQLWQEMDIEVIGDRYSQKLLRLHMYHLMVTASPHNVNLDAGMPARGLHGEAYRGHIFWDELFILPFYSLHYPDVAKSLLMYRYHRLEKARTLARQEGYNGALYPWQSGSSGREESQIHHLNPMSGEWGPDHSSLQRHVSLAIAFNTLQYFHITGDLDFIESFGAEMFFEICRFWADKARWSEETGRFHIDGVMGPDEFHEKYPGSDTGGLTDNAYTNLMTSWALHTGAEIFDALGGPAKAALKERIGIDIDEVEKWLEISRKLNIVMQDGVMAQFDGYFSLRELDWDHYRSAYKSIYRMDRILKKEGKSSDSYKVAKQADTMMAFFNMGRRGVASTLYRMGYKIEGYRAGRSLSGGYETRGQEAGQEFFEKNFDYYLGRTSHGSTLSRVVHSALSAMTGDLKTSWNMYQEALASDYTDIQGGTTGEGIHTGVMSGTVLLAIAIYGGLRLDGKTRAPHVIPALPKLWKKIKFGIWFGSIRYEFEINEKEAVIHKYFKN